MITPGPCLRHFIWDDSHNHIYNLSNRFRDIKLNPFISIIWRRVAWCKTRRLDGVLWVGAKLRQSYGFTMLLAFNLKEFLFTFLITLEDRGDVVAQMDAIILQIFVTGSGSTPFKLCSDQFLPYVSLAGGCPGRHTRRDRCHRHGGQRRELLRWAAERLRCDEEPSSTLQRPALCGPQWPRWEALCAPFTSHGCDQ